MGSSYISHYLGRSLSDEKMQDIPYPKVELTTHVMIKCAQAFTLLGTCLVGPLAAVAKPATRNMDGIRTKAFRFGTRGAIIGAPVGIGLNLLKIKSLEEPAIKDRCYRLRLNQGQMRVDRWSTVAAVAGAGTSFVMGAGAAPGFCLGMSGGILLSAWYTNAGPGKQ